MRVNEAHRRFCRPALLFAGLALSCRLVAQSGPPPAPTAAAPADSVTTLEKFTVSDVPVGEQVLPTVRPVADVMGNSLSVIDTPRSISSVNTAWMRDRMVKNAMDFGQFSPGVYSAAQYGIPAVPFIRGDLSQIYVNGQTAIFSRNGTPPSFNGVESLDIVKGPGSAVYGPQGEGAGGYIDFVMKQPYFDRQHAEIDATFGEWASGHSYSNPEFTLDFGGPVTGKLAYRVSYLSRYGDGYYLNDHDQTQDVYAALDYLATSSLKFEGWLQLYSDRTNEVPGPNRVTQDFIWNGNYVAGPASAAVSGPTAFFGYDIYPAPNPPSGTFGSIPDGSYSVVNPSTAHVVKLPSYVAVISPSDTARAKSFQAQLKTTLVLTADSKLINRSYFANGSSDKIQTYGYDEFVPKQQTIQDRMEFHGNWSTAGIEQTVVTGGDFRYSTLTAYQDYATEPFAHYDLTQPLSGLNYPGFAAEGDTFGGGLSVPGAPGYSAYGGSASNQISHIYDSAAFVQDDIKIGSQISLIPGYRLDYIAANSENPSFVQQGYDNAFFTYVPLATPIYIPEGGSSPYYTGFNVSDTKVDPSYFASLVWKPTETASFYLTYDRVDAILGTTNFGGLDVGAGPGAKARLEQSVTTKSTLYEAGYKESLLHNTFYLGVALFQQLKYGTQFTGATYPIKDNGIEMEAVYQPSKAWTLNANFTFQNATAFGTAFFQQTGNYLDDYSTATTVDGHAGTGLGSPNFTAFHPTGGRMRAPGIPQVQANAFFEYKDPLGWGVGAGPQFIGRQYANDQDTLHIPGEYELDGYVFYGQGGWDVRMNVNNILDRRLLDPIDVSYAGNDTIFVRPPLRASLTLRLHY